MTDETRSDSRVTDKLMSDLQKANSQAAARRHKYKDLETKYQDLESRYQALEAKVSTHSTQKPSELEADNQRLKAQLATIEHRSAFDTVAKASGVKLEALEAAWRLSDYQVNGTAPDPDAIKAQLTKTLETNPFLKGEQTEEVKTLQPGPGLSKGSTGTNGQWVVRSSDVNNGQWMRQNGVKFGKEYMAGRVKLVSD
jgi:hypothetical protein